MALTQDDVRKVASLSRLELDADALDRHARHINELLARFAELEHVDVGGVEPTSHSIPLFNVLRDDVVRPSLTTADTLSNAPEARDGCFIVPRILEE